MSLEESRDPNGVNFAFHHEEMMKAAQGLRSSRRPAGEFQRSCEIGCRGSKAEPNIFGEDHTVCRP
ncbi:MAG: hypothetical protein QM775_12910 [Pirellulales bacterium]